jgi:hypothetical protein
MYTLKFCVVLFRSTDARNVDVIDLSLLINKTAERCTLKICSVIRPSDSSGMQDAANPVRVSV